MAKEKRYDRPYVEITILDEIQPICISGEGSNEDYINDDYEW